MRHVFRRVDEVAGACRERLVAAGELDRPVHDVEALGLAVMHVQRRSAARLLDRLDDAERPFGRVSPREHPDLACRSPFDGRALAGPDDCCVHCSSLVVVVVGGGPTRTTPCASSTAVSASGGTRGPSAGAGSHGQRAGSASACTKSSMPAGVERNRTRAESDSTRNACGCSRATKTAEPASCTVSRVVDPEANRAVEDVRGLVLRMRVQRRRRVARQHALPERERAAGVARRRASASRACRGTRAATRSSDAERRRPLVSAGHAADRDDSDTLRAGQHLAACPGGDAEQAPRVRAHELPVHLDVGPAVHDDVDLLLAVVRMVVLRVVGEAGRQVDDLEPERGDAERVACEFQRAVADGGQFLDGDERVGIHAGNGGRTVPRRQSQESGVSIGVRRFYSASHESSGARPGPRARAPRGARRVRPPFRGGTVRSDRSAPARRRLRPLVLAVDRPAQRAGHRRRRRVRPLAGGPAHGGARGVRRCHTQGRARRRAARERRAQRRDRRRPRAKHALARVPSAVRRRRRADDSVPRPARMLGERRADARCRRQALRRGGRTAARRPRAGSRHAAAPKPASRFGARARRAARACDAHPRRTARARRVDAVVPRVARGDGHRHAAACGVRARDARADTCRACERASGERSPAQRVGPLGDARGCGARRRERGERRDHDPRVSTGRGVRSAVCDVRLDAARA